MNERDGWDVLPQGDVRKKAAPVPAHAELRERLLEFANMAGFPEFNHWKQAAREAAALIATLELDLLDSMRFNNESKVRAEAAESALAAVKAERDEIKSASEQWMEDTGQTWAYVGIRDYAAVKERAEAAESDLTAAREEVERLKEGLRPFAEYMLGGMDLDNKGAPLPDDQGVGWIYLTYAHFRRARALLGEQPS